MGEPGGGVRTINNLLLALSKVLWPSTTHPFRDGAPFLAPFLLLTETPPKVGAPNALFPYLTSHGFFSPFLSPPFATTSPGRGNQVPLALIE